MYAHAIVSVNVAFLLCIQLFQLTNSLQGSNDAAHVVSYTTLCIEIDWNNVMHIQILSMLRLLWCGTSVFIYISSMLKFFQLNKQGPHSMGQASSLDDELDKYFGKEAPAPPAPCMESMKPDEMQDRKVAAMLLRSARTKAMLLLSDICKLHPRALNITHEEQLTLVHLYTSFHWQYNTY